MRKYLIPITMVCILFLFVGIWIGGATMPEKEEVVVEDSVILLPEHPFFLLEDVDAQVLYKTLQHYKFPQAKTITAQAILESGNFQSYLAMTANNLFGLYNSSKGEYFEFDSWISCVFAYRKYILSKYDGKEDYYHFLKRINYASDPNYYKCLKQIEKQIK